MEMIDLLSQELSLTSRGEQVEGVWVGCGDGRSLNICIDFG